MWRQINLSRRTVFLSKIKGASNPKVLFDSKNQIICIQSRELSSHLPKWGFNKAPIFTLFKPFSSDSVLESSDDSLVVENVKESDLDLNLSWDLNDGENPDGILSGFVGNEGDLSGRVGGVWSLEGGMEENGTGFDENGKWVEEIVDNEGGVGGNGMGFEENEWVDEIVDNEGSVEENGMGFEENEEGVEEVVENDVEKVQSLLSLLQSSGGNVNELGNRLNEMKLVLSEEFVMSVIETPLVPAENLIGFYSWCLGKPGFSATKQTIGMLVKAVCREMNKKNAYKLWDLLKEVGEEDGKLSTEILNELISLFSRMSKGKVAYEVFDKFEDFGCVPDAETYYYTTEALFKRSMFEFAASVSQKMVSTEMLPDAEKIGNFIYYLCKGKKSRDAHSVYMLAKEKNKCPPSSSVNVLISSLCFLPKKDKTATRDDSDKLYGENIYLALKILDSFSDKDRSSAAVQPFSSVCLALCKIGDVDKAKGLLFSMIKAGPPPGNAIFNATINGLSKAGELEEAMKLLNVMEDRGLKPDVYAYTVIMSGYAKRGAIDEARGVLEEAKKRHAKLTPVTYHSMIRGYCKLEQFDEAVKLLAEMKDYGVQTNADEYNKLIQTLCMKVLDWGTAEKLLEEMEEKGLYLNGNTRGLIRAVKELEEEGKEPQEAHVGM
ncbi:hypothetical protein Leryth_018779 [Lithospermum erythrorhizon]|nr:hypothetical protein Leryth_018779 [Lithospermum erythrorhizon]